MTSRYRNLFGAGLLWAAGLAAGLAIVAAFTGGFRVRIAGIPLSVRGEHRAALTALVLASAGLVLHAGARRRLLMDGRRIVQPPALAALLSLGVLGIGLVYGTKAAAGADVYGYVSQVPLWQSGRLHVPQPMAAEVPWPYADWSFAPLGYRPAPGHTIVPTYAPGIPLLMVLFSALFGPAAMFWVTPAAGAALVALTYAIGARIASPAIGLAGALSVAANPLVLNMTCWLLGDLPAAALWMLALWCGLRGTPAAAAGAGLATAAAILVRPNLVPLAVFPALLVLRGPAGSGGLRRLVLFGATAAPGPLFIAWLFDHLYGSPLRSGYGENADLFKLEFVGTNLVRFGSWMWTAHGPFLFLFPLALVFAPAGARAIRLTLILYVAAVAGCYLAYLPFDAWWFLRFLLPAVPLMLLLGMDGVAQAARRWHPRLATAAVALAAALASLWGLGTAWREDVTSIGRGEQRYAEVGTYVERVLPPNAVILSMQHSGSLRYYSGRQTIRWDYLPGDWLDRAVAHLEDSGHEVYMVLDEFELPRVRERFTGQDQARVLHAPPEFDTSALRVWIYRLSVTRPGR